MVATETWVNPTTGTVMQVHAASVCNYRISCVVHRPTNHHMREWHLHWRSDRYIFERICPHGIGHPDPDQFDLWKLTGQRAQGVHGCDGCCRKLKGN